MLDQLERQQGIDAMSAEQIRQHAWLEKIRQQADLGSLEASLKRMPAAYKRRSKVVIAAVQALFGYGGHATAHQLLVNSLEAEWDSELAALYGDCHTASIVAQIEQAEKWLTQHPRDANLLLALGKLCVQQKLWGKAQNYLEASISLKPSYAAYVALEQLAERLGRSDESRHYAQKAREISELRA